jgi:hypothetical protein
MFVEARGMRRSFVSVPSAKNAIQRLSGDQKGEKAPSVPGNARADSASAGRTQISGRPSQTATKARVRPLGDMLRLCHLSRQTN